MKRVMFLLAILIGCSIVGRSQGIDKKIKGLYSSFAKYYASGDFINAKECLLKVLELKDSIPEKYVVASYCNLGSINNLWALYDEALRYYDMAEMQMSNKQDSILLAEIYINKAGIFDIQGESKKALNFFEKGIRIYLSTKNPDQYLYQATKTQRFTKV